MPNSGNSIELGELAKLIDSRIHDYARDSLQRFALVFSMGTVAISLLFTAAVRMFLEFPIDRLVCETLNWPNWAVTIVRYGLLAFLVVALIAFLISFSYVFKVFHRLHGFEAIKVKEKPKNRKTLRLKKKWNKLARKLNLKTIGSDVSANILHDSFNILWTLQIASYASDREFIQIFAELFHTNSGSLDRTVVSVLRDAYRIVQRTLMIDRWYFVRALFFLLVSFGLICLTNAVFFAVAIFFHAEEPFAKGIVAVKSIMLQVDGESIDLDIYEPAGKVTSKTFQAIIIVPGGRGKNYVMDPDVGVRFKGYSDLAAELAKRGFYTFVFDGRGQGQSEGLMSHQNGLLDLQKVIDVTSEYPEVDLKNIGVFGRCGGGAIALHMAMRDNSRIKSIMTWGMPPCFDEFDKNEIEQRLLQAGVRLKKGATFLNGEDATLRVYQPLLVAGGTEDTDWFFIKGSAKQQLDMIDAISKRGTSKKIRFEVLRGAPHGVDSKHKCFEQFVDLVSEWFQDTLK